MPDSRYGIAFGISNCVTGSGMVDMVDRDYLPADPPEVALLVDASCALRRAANLEPGQ